MQSSRMMQRFTNITQGVRNLCYVVYRQRVIISHSLVMWFLLFVYM